MTEVFEMFKNTLVVLPARGGSKRIKKKNIVPILGKPMIHWPLNVLCALFTNKNIMISTDDFEIKNKVKCYDILTEYTRPKSLSDDFTTSMSILPDAIEWFQLRHNEVEYVLMVYPTAILLKCESIYEAYKLIQKHQADVVIAATDFCFPIQRSFSMSEDDYIEYREPEYFDQRSQDLTKYYHDAGQFYLFKKEKICQNLKLSDLMVCAVNLNRSEVIDIDEPEDLKIAELLLKNMLEKGV